MALTIFIKDLVISGTHGVHEHEKKTPQRFRISVELTIAGESEALTSDRLEDTLDWSHLRDEVVRIVEQDSYELVERLAKAVADAMLADARVTGVIVTIEKLDAFPAGVPGVRLEPLPLDSATLGYFCTHSVALGAEKAYNKNYGFLYQNRKIK